MDNAFRYIEANHGIDTEKELPILRGGKRRTKLDLYHNCPNTDLH